MTQSRGLHGVAATIPRKAKCIPFPKAPPEIHNSLRLSIALRIPPPMLFLVRAVAVVALLPAITLTGPFQRWIEEPLITLNARLSHWLLGLFGAKTQLSGNVLSGNLPGGPSSALE